jgi:hypothetical protein
MHEENESPSRNVYKVKAFKSAISTLKQLDHPLRSVEEAGQASILFILEFTSFTETSNLAEGYRAWYSETN